MAQPVTARRDGDAFQARVFWWYAARLLDSAHPVTRVGFEFGPKGFDDVWVEFEKNRGPLDHYGVPLTREHIQCKWHASSDSYGHADLIDPQFINANAKSLLERARHAQLTHAPGGSGVRFRLLTNWRIERNDPLRLMVGTRSGAIRVERLFGSGTDSSKSGQVRKVWREHLDIDEEELRRFARALAFGETTDTLDMWRDHLDVLFHNVGLRRVPAHESTFPYDDTVFQWMGQGRIEFDRASFLDACTGEGLLCEAKPTPRIFGVKSFEHPIDRLEDRCSDVLNLIPVFDERYIRSESDWTTLLYPALRAFLLRAATEDVRLRLALDAHSTLAFAAGSILNIKSGRYIELEQRTLSRRFWSADDEEIRPEWASLASTVVELRAEQPDLAVAIGLTHDVETDVHAYVSKSLPSVGRLLILKPSTGVGPTSVACGAHAFQLADQATQTSCNARPTSTGTLHMFVAGPNAFAFFLGQRQAALGRLCLYEFDLEGGRDRTYRAALSLPPSPHVKRQEKLTPSRH
ncbi:MAG: SAVED domain-containing protein [Vicinamibacterales bacterium]